MLIKNIVTYLGRLVLLLAALTLSSGVFAQVALNLVPGWNLLGNSSAAPIDVATTFGDASKIKTVWKWNRTANRWAVYAPSMTPSALTTYAQGHGYDVLTSIAAKEGFWANASTAVALSGPFAPPPAAGAPAVTLVESDLQQGWNLIGSADNKTPSQLNAGLNSSLNAAGKAILSAWAWDATNTKWKFFAPSLEAQGGTALRDYITGKDYLPFDTPLSAADGAWLNLGPASGTGQITIVKNAQPYDTQGFSFTSDQAMIAPFVLVDDSNTTLTNQNVFSNLWPGSYSFAETQVNGWSLASIVCTPSAGATTNLMTGAATITLAAGDNITCTFTNTKQKTDTGTLTIVKVAQPQGPQAFHFATVGAGLSAFDLDDDPTNNTLLNTKTFTNLAAGIPFTVTEDAVSGWTVPSIQCLVAIPGLTTTFTDQLNRTFTVNLEAGANVTCTFTNVKTQTTKPITFTAVSAPTLNVSTQAMMPTVLATSTSFTSSTTNNVTTANVTAGPTGVTNDSIRTLANANPGATLVGAVATLPSSILLASGPPALSMTATSCGGTSGGIPCPAASLIPLLSSDFGVWAIRNDLALPLPANSVISYSTFAGGTLLTANMPNSGAPVTYTGKMTGVLANAPVGGSDDVSGDVSLTVDFVTNQVTSVAVTNIITGAGASTITPCVYPAVAAACTYAVYAPLNSPPLPSTFANISLTSGPGNIIGNSFTATVGTASILLPTIKTMTGNFYGATANEVAGTFTISLPGLGSPGPGLTLIGSFGAK